MSTGVGAILAMTSSGASGSFHAVASRTPAARHSRRPCHVVVNHCIRLTATDAWPCHRARTEKGSEGEANRCDSAVIGERGIDEAYPVALGTLLEGTPGLLPSGSTPQRSGSNALARLVLLTDRSPREALPALETIGLDVKVEPLGVDSLAHLPDIAPQAIVVDGAENPAHAHSILAVLAAAGTRLPVMVIAERADLDRIPWHEVADDLVYPGAPEQELRVRLAMLGRRIGGS